MACIGGTAKTWACEWYWQSCRADGDLSLFAQSPASIATLGLEATETQLRELLSQETLAWVERSPADIVAELAKPQTYRRGTGGGWHEIEVTLLEATDDFIHVKTSIHDGSLVWALKPITSSFLIYRDGRIEI